MRWSTARLPHMNRPRRHHRRNPISFRNYPIMRTTLQLQHDIELDSVMPNFWTNKLTLTTLHLLSLGEAFVRYRNPRRRKFGQQLDAFNERAWREAAETLGASFESLGSGI